MLRPFLTFFGLLLAVQVPCAAEAASAAETVRAFYAPEVWNPLASDDFSQLTGPALALFTKSARLSAESGEMGCVDFVVTIAAQDYDEAEIARSIRTENTGRDAGGNTHVTARFENFQAPQEILWTLREEHGVWKVSDIESKKDGWRLSEFPCE